MNLLSRVTRHYFENHLAILKGFIVEWNPQIVCELDFGDTNLKFDSTDLDQQTLKSLPRYKRNKLSEIRFKSTMSFTNLLSIKLVFEEDATRPTL